MPTITILGGGLAGLSLALCLRKQDIHCEIYEVRDESFRKGGDIALSPNALRVLDHVGVYGKLRRQGWNYDSVNMLSVGGKYLGSHTWGGLRKYHYHCLRINRDIVRQALLKEVRAHRIPVHLGKKCIQISEVEDEVTMVFDDGAIIRSDFVIGADGIHSIIRQYLYPGTHAQYSGLLVALGHTQKDRLTTSMGDVQLPVMFFGKNGTFSVLPNDYEGSEIGYFITTDVPDRGAHDWALLEKDKDAISRIFDEITEERSWPDFVKELPRVSTPENFRIWPFAKVPDLDHWVSSSGRIILIGDAAHAIPPAGGQGAASAFEDAETLSHVLAKLSLPDTTLSDLKTYLRHWESHRMERIREILAYTEQAGNIRKRSSGLAKVLKEWMIWMHFKFYELYGGGTDWIYNYQAENIISVIAK